MSDTRQWRRRSLPRAIAACAVWLLPAAGCRHHEDPPSGEPVTLAARERAAADADRMIEQGRHAREEGIDLREQGKDGDALIKRGELMMAEGQQKREAAMLMRTR